MKLNDFGIMEITPSSDAGMPTQIFCAAFNSLMIVAGIFILAVVIGAGVAVGLSI